MNQIEQHRMDHPRRMVALVGLRDDQGNIFLVRNRKLADWWQPLGGGIEPQDTSPKQAAVRELMEEAGIQVEASALVPVLEVPYDFGEGTVYFYELQVDRDALAIRLNDREIIECQWFTPAAVQDVPVFPGTKKYLQTLA